MAIRAVGMSGHILQGAPPVPLVLRKSARARRITLRVSAVDGQVTVTMPKFASERQALEFAELKADWIRGHLQNHPGQMVVGFGSEVLVDGRPRTILPTDGRKIQLTDDALCVPRGKKDVARAVEAWLKARARVNLGRMVADYGDAVGRRATALALRDTRSRWGSCTSAGRIMLSWRLIMAPPEVQGYVAAHEVAHLVEMNHSSSFWSKVAQIYGDYDGPRRWLNNHGIDLHRYKFRV